MRVMGCLRKKKRDGYKKAVIDITVSELISFLLRYQGQRTVKACVEHKAGNYQIIRFQEQDGQLILIVEKDKEK